MITLEANYSKKIGLPDYSSHQFSVTLKSELADASQAEQESARLYALLQTSVDQNIQQVGYLPKANGKAQPHVKPNTPAPVNGHQRQIRPAADDPWKCSVKQKDLILKITDENQLDKTMVDNLAVERFGYGVKLLNKLEASGLIEELIEKYPSKSGRGK